VGFSPAGAAAERALEAKFDANLSAQAIRERLQQMSAEPNQVGSPHDKANAEFTLAQYKAWGWDAHIEVFNVLYPTPVSEHLELLGEHPYVASLTEPPVPGDASSSRQAGGLPAWLAYAGDGDVTAPLVYVNYGMPDDYKALARMGVDVKGKIVIVRYGAGWRGLKPKLAQEHGAVGCIIYSDPADDGYGPGDPYPKGGWRNPDGIQRGSVMDMPIRAGDPLTPNVGATADAKRIPIAEAETILKIPALPISYGQAQHFLAALGGQVAPKGWRGQLPITYHVGGDASAPQVHLEVKADWSQKPLYDVIAVMKGSEHPDEWVVRGNHRDGWVFGAGDPLSGQTATMEEARSLGLMAKAGWRPKRTLVYASWDGEEPGLLGSTEWAEAHAAELQAKAVVYINSDGNGRGFLGNEASYTTRRLLDEVAADVKDPETGASARDRVLAQTEVRGQAPDASEADKRRAAAAARDRTLPVGDLGSGSDYSPFVQHLGLTSINIGYGGEGQGAGVYHSAYDDFEHYEAFEDPGNVYGVTLAQTGGRLVLRMADADLVPLSFANLADTVGGQVEELKKSLDTMRTRTETNNRLVEASAFTLAADPTQPNAQPPKEDTVPAIDFKPLEDAVARLRASASAYDAAAADPARLKPAQRAQVDALLQGAEQGLTDARGLPGRPWYKHLLYAPGVLTGYGAKTLPGVREAIEDRRWAEASEYVARTAAVLQATAERLDHATALLKGS
ncbi:MAG TPA: transferrin receptor-like dimerization domain-containing protein, partial [Caulobacteraceae bacterium]|nr:transferrin receptor-like dimerization domain-containing protein [Caulobacteraceae bacterium]